MQAHQIPDDPSVIQPIFESLKKAFFAGKTRDLSFRKQQLKNILKGLKELTPELCEASHKDLGGGLQMGGLQVSMAGAEVEEVLENIDEWNKPIATETSLGVGPGESYLLPEPLGTVLVIAPWNAPLVLSIPYLATAIAAGNTVLVKTSEMAPENSRVITQLVEKYLDKECFRCIEGKVEVAKAVITFPWDKIVFTGSTEKGRIVAKAAAEHLTPCVLELGGKSPTIVDKDADIDNAALRIAQGKLINAGQICVANDYVFVHKSIKAKFTEAIKKRMIEFYGEDASKSPEFGRIVNEFHCNRIKCLLDEDHKGKVVLGGEVRVNEKYVAPTIIDSPSYESQIMKDEIFGPVLLLQEYEDIDFAINYINLKPKPLAIYFYGNASSANYKKVKTFTSSGGLVLNDSVFHFSSPYLPFGGVGASGTGFVHGFHGFRELVHLKPILEKGTNNSYPFNARFPPGNAHKGKIMMFILKNSRVKESTLKKTVASLVLIGAGIVAWKKGYLDKVKNFVSDAIKK
jgi:aldehyde dehydrogenase (NAD+)